MDGTKSDIYFLVFASILLFFSLNFFIVSFFRYYRKKQRSNFSEKEEMKISFKQELLQTQLEIREQTLHHISQEIHDNIGQVLSLAKLNLNTLDPGNLSALLAKTEASENLVSKAIQDLRDIAKGLNSDYVLEMGLGRSIEYNLEMIKKTGSYETSFIIEGNLYKLAKQKELILFRIFQEVLNNAVKHAKASLIVVKLFYLPDKFSIDIRDNGEGFDLAVFEQKRNASSGLGIRNMENRARLIGASFSLKSRRGEGTMVNIQLPN